jgi:NADP-dependent 3-hydroxy acid dehydrogenase YdfG
MTRIRVPGRRRRGGEVVAITGASAGVGRAIAHAFARRGAHVALLARDSNGLASAAAEVKELGGRALALPVDVVEADAVAAAAAAVEEQWGPLDVWVNDAMATILAPLHATTPAEFERATKVTYLGTVYVTMAALSRMRPRDRGVIVQVGSALSYRAIPLQAAYCGAKFAIRGFTDSVRTELLHEHSRVWITMVQLPAVNTPQFDWCLTRMAHHPQPVAPIFQPEVPAEAVYWAAHHRRRELWVGHSTVEAILASYLAPSLADRYLARTGYDSQQMPELPVAADRPANLFSPVPRLSATHGRFDERATPRSPQLWLTMHRATAAAASAVAAAAVLSAARRR